MSYQVLARKYRPRRFADMVGQDAVVRTLTNALSGGRVHHAYVFSGIRGIGKTTSARLLASALNCIKGPTTDPCGTCAACVEIAEGRSIDAIEIDAASNRGIDEVKALVQSAQYSPSRDRHKVFIVDEFHMLTREAFNALLKTLEEPPPHVVFILATTELEKVPATILSRCLLLPFRPVSAKDLRDHLLEVAGKENVRLDPGAAELIARKAGGSIRDAQSTLDRVIALAGDDVSRDAAAQVLGLTDAAVLRGVLAAALEGRAAAGLEVIDQVTSSGADLHAFLDELLAEARATLLVKILPDPAPVLGLPDAAIAELRTLAAAGSEDDLRRIVDRLIEAGPRLRTAAEPRFVLEALVVRLAHLTRLEPLADIVARLERGEGGPPAGGGSPRPSPSPPDRDHDRPSPPPSAPPARSSQSAAPPPPSTAAPKSAPSASSASSPAAAPATDKGGSSWRERLSSAPVAEPELPPDPLEDAGPRSSARPTRSRQALNPLESFRGALTARMRGQVEHGILRREGDGVLLLLPADRDIAREHLDEHRFHVMAAASEAFGRPVPVRIGIQADLVDAPTLAGDVEGSDLVARRLTARAERSSLVQSVRGRFDARIVSVVPSDVDPSSARH